MAWKIGRGRYGAEALTEEEIQQLQGGETPTA